MNGLSAVLTLVMSQSIVRDLAIDRPAVTDVQIIAANDDFVWFMPREGRLTTLTSGGPSVFRLEKATNRVHPCIGNTARQLTRFNLCRTCAEARGQSLFTLDGEFGPDGTLLTPVPGTVKLFSSGPNMVMTWGETAFLSLAPGALRQLNGRYNSFVPSTDGRFAAEIYGVGDRCVVFERDGSQSPHDGEPAGYAGNSFLFVLRGNLVNEDDEVMGPAGQPSPARVSRGLEAFELDDGQLLVTDATFTGTHFVDRRDAGQTLNVTRQFATFGAGQMMTVVRYADGARFTVPAFDGQSLDDRLIRGNLELYADGGVVRRAEFADCPWKRWGQSPELLCDGDGGIWSRDSADSPQRQLMMGHPIGVGGPAFVAAGLLNGGPLLALAPSVQWTDGVTVARISMKDSSSAIGMLGSRVVLFEGAGVEAPRGVVLVDPLSGKEQTLGLSPEWRPMPTGRELFLHRDATCEVMLLNNDGVLVPIKRACLESVVAAPGGVMAISREPTKGKWLVFDPQTSAFLQTDFSNEHGDRPLANARNGRAVFSRAQQPWFGIPGQSLDTNSQWNSAVVDLETGANVSGSANAMAVSPQGVISWSLAPEGPPTIQTWAGATFEAAGSVAPWRFTWTEKSLWMMSQSDVRVFVGDGFRVVSTEPARWWNSYAVGENLVVPAGRTISVLSPSGAARVLTPGEIQNVRVLRDVMWLSINDGVHGYEPYRFDGESLEFVADLVPGPLPSFPLFLQYARGRMLMEAGRADGTIGITSVEFQPEPQDDTARSPWDLKAAGCQGCSQAHSIEWLAALALVVLRGQRRVRAA